MAKRRGSRKKSSSRVSKTKSKTKKVSKSKVKKPSLVKPMMKRPLIGKLAIAKPVKPVMEAYINIGHMNALKSNSYMIKVFSLIGVLFTGYLASQYYSGNTVFNLIVFSFIFLLNMFVHKKHKTVVRLTFFASLISLILSVSVTLLSAQFISVTLIGLSFLILLFSISNLKYSKFKMA